MDTFADLMASERERIISERMRLTIDRAAIDVAIQALDREMDAVNAYERAKDGKAPKAHKVTNGAARMRGGSKREAIVQIVTVHPEGISRGELLEMIGVKGDKSGEMSVSNALTALIKNDTLMRNEEKKYVLSV